MRKSHKKSQNNSRSLRQVVADETVGWLSTVMILGAYFANLAGWISAQNVWYIWLNIIGGVGLAIYAWTKKDFPLVIVNAVWAVGALVLVIFAR